MSTAPEATRDVVRDLLPAYASGEASADTRRFVEAWLGRDATLAREAEALRAAEDDLAAAPAGAARPDAERATLLRLRGLLRAQSFALAGGIFFSLLPFSFVFSSEKGFRFLLFRDAPVVGAFSAVMALASWMALVALTRRLRGPGR